MNNITSKISKHCLSHQCNECGKNLRINMSFGEKVFLIVMFTIMLGSMGFFVWFDSRISNTSNCYTREYIIGRGTDFETLRNNDIECPK